MNQEDREFLVRLDERLQGIDRRVASIDIKLERHFVTRTEFESKVMLLESKIQLMQRVVYGFVGLILSSFGVALIAKVITT